MTEADEDGDGKEDENDDNHDNDVGIQGRHQQQTPTAALAPTARGDSQLEAIATERNFNARGR